MFPTKPEAAALLTWAEGRNPGAWVRHSRVVAKTAQAVAACCTMDADKAYTLGLLHDIGRYKGPNGLRHVLCGYKLMLQKGFPEAARICLTHSFPYKNIASYQGKQDCTDSEIAFLQNELDWLDYDDYDKLIQLCDCLALPDGVCLLESRMVDVAQRDGFNRFTLDKWYAFFALKTYFDKKCGMNIYKLFEKEIVKGIFA
jgi:putative nucleotidyltransferase with HDIG domain